MDFSHELLDIGENLAIQGRDLASGMFDYNPPIGAIFSFVPILGEILWKIDDNCPFFGYVCKVSNDRKIGFLRIPHYDYNKDNIRFFEEIISQYEKLTDVLVLDQVDNEGGSVFQMYSILSILADRPLKLPKHFITICEADYIDAKKALEKEKANTNNSIANEASLNANMISYYEFLVSEKEAGRGTVQNPSPNVYLYGISEIYPARIHYTKRIIVLINELDFSASEFLAAILQDNHRAMLFGTRTAGAGGCVRRLDGSRDDLLGVEYITYTWSMLWRTNGNTIESDGVSPDIEYSLTDNDVQNGYPGYKVSIRPSAG
jgi:hypothetical protein